MVTQKRIAYLGKIQLTDTDFSFLHEGQKFADITYYMEVTPRYKNGPALSIKELYPKSGIFKAIEVYPEFEKYKNFINVNKCYVVNTTGSLWQLKSIFINIILLFKLIYRGFDVIHIVWPLNFYELALYFLHKKMILTVHDPFPHSGLNSKIVKFRRYLAFKFVDNLIILNQNQKQDFIDYYKLGKKNIISSRLSNFIFLQTIDSNNNASKSPYILAFGKISRYKGFDYLLPAMEIVHLQYPDVKLIIAGNGSFHFDITEYQNLDYIDIRNRFIPDDEMVSLVKNALFMVCPYTDATQSGVIMSSYAFYRPVVATNVGGLPEMVVNGRHGLIVQEKNIEALSTAIIDLLNNQELIEQYSNNIQKDYSTGSLSWNFIAHKLVEEYEKMR